jgi:hypothetical protein
VRILDDAKTVYESCGGLTQKFQDYAERKGWTEWTKIAAASAGAFTLRWEKAGRPTYQLDHSIAAMLSVTRSTPIDWDRLPMPAFLITVPRAFCPLFSKLDHPPPIVWIAIGRQGDHMWFGTGSSEMLSSFVIHGPDQAKRIVEDLRVDVDPNARVVTKDSEQRGFTIAIRLAANVIAYVTNHREAVRGDASPRTGRGSGVMRVTAPRDVTVDREFRDAASRLVCASSFAGAKLALSHMVRGHWRNQATGEGRAMRRMTWVRPHRRGEEGLGSVVKRVERLTARHADP